MKATLAILLVTLASAPPLRAQGVERLSGMPGGLAWGASENAVTAELGEADQREELPVRGIVRLSYAAEGMFPGTMVSYDFAPGRGLAKGDYVFTVSGECEEAYEAVARVLGAPFAGNEDLNFCGLPASMPIASQKDAAGAVLGVTMDPRSRKVIITYESPFYSSFVTGGG